MNENGERQRVGFRIVTGGGTLVNPMIEKVGKLSLELMTVGILSPVFASPSKGRTNAQGVAQIKISSDNAAIRRAAGLFLDKSVEEVKMTAAEVIIGHLTAAVASAAVSAGLDAPDLLTKQVSEAAASDLRNMGLEIVSIAIWRADADAKGEHERAARSFSN